MWNVVEVLSRYIDLQLSIPPIAGWLTIAALVIAQREAVYLLFRSPKRREVESQQSPEALRQIYYRTRRREICLFVLATALSWMLLFSLIVEHRGRCSLRANNIIIPRQTRSIS